MGANVQKGFSDLPKELIELTFSFIKSSEKSNKAKRTARAVCKKWMQIIGVITFDIYVPLPNQISSIAETFSRCPQPFSLTVHKWNLLKHENIVNLVANLVQMVDFTLADLPFYIPPSKSFINVDLLTNLQRIKTPNIGIEVHARLPNLTYLEAAQIKFSDRNCFPNLKYLSIHNRENRDIFTLVTPRLSTLHSNADDLPASALDFVKNLKVMTISSIESFGEVVFPNLEELELTRNFYIGKSPKLTRLSLQSLSYEPELIGSATNLQELTLISPLSEDSLSVLMKFPHLNSFQWMNKWPQGNSKGDCLQYLNPYTLTRLSIPLDSSVINRTIQIFTKLQILNIICQNKVDPDLVVLSTLTQLQSLSISGTNKIDMDWITHLTLLNELVLYCSHKNGPLDVANLTNLTLLMLDEAIMRPAPNLTKLRNLALLCQMADDFTFICNFTKLTSLKYQRMEKATIPANHLSKLQKLRELSMRITSTEQFVALAGLPRLTMLTFWSYGDTQVDIHHLTLLTRLQRVDLASPYDDLYRYPAVLQKMPYLIKK